MISRAQLCQTWSHICLLFDPSCPVSCFTGVLQSMEERPPAVSPCFQWQKRVEGSDRLWEGIPQFDGGISLLHSSSFRQRRPLLLRPWYEPLWPEGADVAEQRVCCVRPGPAGDRRQHRLLAPPGGGHHPAHQPDHRDAHVAALRPVEGLFPGRWAVKKVPQCHHITYLFLHQQLISWNQVRSHCIKYSIPVPFFF